MKLFSFKDARSLNFPWRIFSRLLLIQGLIILLALGATGFAARYFFKRVFVSEIRDQLHHTLIMLSQTTDLNLQQVPLQWCQQHSQNTNFRFTLIDQHGKVLCDSDHAPETMQNHADRPEVIAALKTGFGSNVRSSDTIKKEMVYAAISMPNESVVLRVAVPLSARLLALRTFDISLGSFLLLLALSLAIYAFWAGRVLVFPFGRVLTLAKDIHARSLKTEAIHSKSRSESVDTYETSFGDWSDLESSIHSIRRDLEETNESLSLERQELSTLMASISDAVLALDPEGLALFYNSRFALLFGKFDSTSPLNHLFEGTTLEKIKTAFSEALNLSKACTVEVIPFHLRTGKRYFSVSVAPLKRRSGKTYGVLGIFHDVTELKLAEQIRIDFVANVSHELRTPLTAIQGYTETLLEDVESDKKISPDFLTTISRNVQRLIELIDDLLDLSSLESGSVQPHKEWLETSDVTTRILIQFAKKLELRNQRIEVKLRINQVFADANQLEQVMINLLDNANKFSPDGGVIHLSWEPGLDSSILLKVADSGQGISPEHHPRLFERFYRVDKARSRKKGGTGLGLAIVKHIMQIHNGSISVQSIPGQGATFICQFPAG